MQKIDGLRTKLFVLNPIQEQTGEAQPTYPVESSHWGVSMYINLPDFDNIRRQGAELFGSAGGHQESLLIADHHAIVAG
jgi:hypothetical protein